MCHGLTEFSRCHGDISANSVSKLLCHEFPLLLITINLIYKCFYLMQVFQSVLAQYLGVHVDRPS
jgi:hypothetical protein